MMFHTITIIGFGLIGSSLARKIKAEGLCEKLICGDVSQEVCDTVSRLNLADESMTDLKASVQHADLVIIAVPVGAYGKIGNIISSGLKAGAIITDVGSVKGPVIQALCPFLPDDVSFVPAHPIAGTEKSGPEAGFSNLFEGHWTILTPLEGEKKSEAVQKISRFWEACGSMVEIMSPKHHDRVLGITSHLPHLIAYTIVGTATDLEEDTQSEIIKYSAGGFRDFTRIAAGDPTMWRDIFLSNKEAILDVLQRFNEDLTELQKAIRKGESEQLFHYFEKTSAIRKGVIKAKQEIPPVIIGDSRHPELVSGSGE